ncbi:MAG: HD domain-containing protein [Clostridia bacterium]|nr:HD domain-containing protein [Clostridia bacterium]
MEKIFVKELEISPEKIDLFFMVKSISIKIGSNGKSYLDLTLGDKTGDVSSKKWNITPDETPRIEEIKEGDIVKVRAQVKEWNGNKQLDISIIRKAVEGDEIDLSDYIKKAPEESKDMFDYLYETAEAFQDEELKKLCHRILDDNKEQLMYWPAASKNHHAIYGGLLYHTKRMLESADALCKVYGRIINEDLLKAGVILHDIEKLREIKSDLNGISDGYYFEGQLLGHIVQGIKSIEKYCEELGVSYEKRIMLEHMILAHHYEPEFGSPKKPLFPEAELLHYLDIIDARMYDFEDALMGVGKEEFSDRVFTLDNRKLYKASDSKID